MHLVPSAMVESNTFRQFPSFFRRGDGGGGAKACGDKHSTATLGRRGGRGNQMGKDRLCSGRAMFYSADFCQALWSPNERELLGQR